MKRLFILTLVAFAISACTPEYQDPGTARATYGSPQAQVVVEEFGDYQCPACGTAYPLMKRLKEKYGQRVLWKYYNYPLISIHPYAFNAALAAECANDQDKFWEMHDLLYENQAKLTKNDLYAYGEQLDLNLEGYKACIQSRAKSKLIQEDIALGDSRGVNSTPTVFVNGEKLVNWTMLESRLDTFFVGTDIASTTPTN
jgi:protein-disulfide isomerase